MTTKNNAPTPDATRIRQALDVLFQPGDVVEIRALHIPARGKPHTASGCFDDFDRATQAAVALDGRKPAGIYVTLNRLNAAVLARSPNSITDYPGVTASDNDVTRRRWLPLDCDPIRPAGVSSTDEEQQAAIEAAKRCREWLSTRAWPEPILASSGNGSHLLYRIDLPNDSPAQALVQGVLAAINTEINGNGVEVDQTVHNAARIFRLYGTTARKGHPLPDRPHRVSELLSVPDAIATVSIDQLQALADECKTTSTPGSKNGNGYAGDKLDVAAWLNEKGVEFTVKNKVGSRGQTIYALSRCPFDESHADGDACVMQDIDGKLSAKCFHNSCSGKGWREFRDALDPTWHDRRGVTRQRSEYNTPPSGNGQPGECRRADTSESVEFEIVSCRELAGGDYNVRFLVQDVLVEGAATMIGGQLKVLKTSLSIALAVSLATGKPFLDTFEVLQPSRVLYFLGEGGLTVAQSCARRVAESHGIDLEDISALGFCSKVPQLGSLEEMDAVTAALTENEATVAIFDPLYLMLCGENSGNIMAQGPIFRNFNRACEKVGVTPIIVHHLRKNRSVANPFDPPELAELAWSGPAEFAGGWLLVGRTEAFDPDNPGRHSLWLSAGGRAGHSSLHVLTVNEGRHTDPRGRCWSVDVQAPQDARRASHDRLATKKEEADRKKLERNRKKVIEALEKYPAGETKTTLRNNAGLHSSAFNTALADVLSTGEAEPCGVLKSGRKTPLDGYRLVDTDVT